MAASAYDSSSGGSGNCTSSGGGRPGPGPAGREPQERERAEEGEEEGKEEEERSSQQARGGRTSWCGGCQQPRKKKTERSGERPIGATREETWEGLSPRRPPRRQHLRDRGEGAEPPPSRFSRPSLGTSEAAPELRQGGGSSFFSGQQTFHGDALRGEVRPPKRTRQPLIAAYAPPPPPPRAAGAKEALGKGQSHTLGGRNPRPSSVAAVESLQTQLWSSATTAAGKTCPCPPTPAASPALFSLHQPGTPQFPEGPPAMSDPDIRRGPDVPAMWPPCSRGA